MEAFTTSTPPRERRCLRTHVNTGNAPLGQAEDPFFLWQWQETLAHIRYLERTSNEAGCGLSSRNSHWSSSCTFSSQLFIYTLPNQGPSKLQGPLINLFQALALLVIHVTRRRKLDGGILVTVGPVSIHSIILPHLQAEHHWAASTCSSVNLQEVAGDVRVSLLHALLQFPISVLFSTL